MAYSEAIAALGLQTPWDDLIIAMGGDTSSIALIKGVIATESQWNPQAVNPSDPSYGLMQILQGSRGPYPSVSVNDLLDPSTNITLGSTFLKNQISRFGMPGGVAAYNSGTPRTLPGGQYVNQAYVDSVLSYQSYYLSAAYGVPSDGGGGWTPVADILRPIYSDQPYDVGLTVTGFYGPTYEPSMDYPYPGEAEPSTGYTGSPFLSLELGIAIGLGMLGLAVVLNGGKVKKP